MAVYLFLLALAGQALFHYAVQAWKNRFYPGFGVFFLLQAALVLWIVCYLGEQTDADRRQWWFLFKFTAVGTVAPSWFLFILIFTGAWTKPLGWWRLVYGWAAILPVLALTNPSHHWFFRELVLRHELIGLNGPLFPFHLGWNYLLLVASLGLLIRFWLRKPAKRRTTTSLLLAGSIPFLANILNEFTKDPVTGAFILPVNPTLPAFIASSLIFAWAVFAQRLLDPRPLARERLFNVLQEGVLVLDAEGRVVDANESARKLLETPGTPLLGVRLDAADTPLSTLAKARLIEKPLDEPWEIDLVRHGEALHYDVRLLPLQAGDAQPAGWLLSMRNLGSRRHLLRMEELGLSPREQELVEWVNQGLSNKEIASLLAIGTATVKNHLYNIFRKCQVTTRQELLRVLKGLPHPAALK